MVAMARKHLLAPVAAFRRVLLYIWAGQDAVARVTL
jgi:hypothetical protein